MSNSRFKTKLCRNYALGHCPQGEHCKYLHSTNIPANQARTTATATMPVMTGTAGYAPHMSHPPAIYPMNVLWPITSPPIQTANASGFNWTYPSFSPPPTSPSTTSQPTQFRPLSWRTTLCRHFVKNQGWCPLGDECGYIHDMALADQANNDIRFPGGNRGNATGRAGTKHSHCWAYVQGLCRVKDCPYMHPVAINLFIPHTPCLAWPNCTRGPLCAYKHPEPLITRVPEMAQAPPPLQVQPPSPVRIIPSGTVQYQGTTYFPVAPNGPPQLTLTTTTTSSPHYAWSISPVAPSAYSPYSPDSVTFHSPFYEAVPALPNAAMVPRAFVPPPPPLIEGGRSFSGSSTWSTIPPPVPSPEPRVESPAITASEEPTVVQASGGSEDMPYIPAQPTARMGHARRISVVVKSKEDSDALGLPTTAGYTRRESWMGHRHRDDPSHRSWPWAPDSIGVPTNSPGQIPLAL